MLTKRHFRTVIIFFLSLFVSSTLQAVEIYLDPDQPIEARIADLIPRLTLQQKASLMYKYAPAIPELSIPYNNAGWNQVLHGVATNRNTTMFPIPPAMSATWDPNLIRDVASAISDELWICKKLDGRGLICRSPVIDMVRTPLYGRICETWGEDVSLTTTMASAFVRGLQGDHPKYLKAAATLKHMGCYDVEQNRTTTSTAVVSERWYHEYFTRNFRNLAVDAKAQSIMISYNNIAYAGGPAMPVHANPAVAKDTIKNKWGWDGFVVSDTDGVIQLRTTKNYVSTNEEAAAAAVSAGVDSSDQIFMDNLANAVNNGRITEADLDESLERVLRVRFRIGDFDPIELNPYNDIPTSALLSPENRALSLKTAQESIVLLENKDSFLPLNKNAINKIAVIGPHADRFYKGAPGYDGNPVNPVKPIDGIRNRVNAGTEVVYALGCPISGGSTQVDNESGFSGGQSVKLNALGVGDYVEFTVPVSAGTYNIQLRYKSFETRGIYQLSIDGVNQGTTVDMYGSSNYNNIKDFGNKTFSASANAVFRFTVTGQNAGSSGYSGHFDYISLSGTTYETEDLSYTAGSTTGGIESAATLAGDSDVAIVYVGTDDTIEREGNDRESINLPGEQLQLVQAVYQANPNTVVVLMNAGPLSVRWIKDNVKGVIEAFFAGEEGGNAIADVIFGNVNPCGKLPYTVYEDLSELPGKWEYDISKGYTYMYFTGTTQFPFGHGLCYTALEYSNLSVTPAAIPEDGQVEVSFDLKNTGSRPGAEVVQLYVHNQYPTITPAPMKELKGFKKVYLNSGETKNITFTIKASDLTRYQESTHDFIVDSGIYDLMIGSSSADIRLNGTFTVGVPCVNRPVADIAPVGNLDCRVNMLDLAQLASVWLACGLIICD